MNKRCCSRTENRTAANITAGYQYTWQGAKRSVPIPLDAGYRLRRDCCAAAAVRVTAALLSLSHVLMCSTAVDDVLSCWEQNKTV